VTTQPAAKIKFSSYHVLVIILLALTQFTVVLDFMIMSPLGDMLMKSMSLSTTQFGFAVSGYAFSAGIPDYSPLALQTGTTVKNSYSFFTLVLLQARCFVV